MSSRFASKGQIDFALSLGAIESESQGRQMTKKAISRLIESAKESRYAELCCIYEELDDDLQRSGHILDFAEKVTTLKAQGGAWHCGPCPECGGVDRFYINTRDNKFKCGHASGGHGCGWAGGLANLAAYVWGCKLWDAIDSLTGQSPRKEPVVRARRPTRVPIQPKKPALDTKPYGDFSGVCEASVKRLRAPDGQAGRDYLALRGITQAAWEANRVGLYDTKRRGPAICFPHSLVVDGSITIVSLNRRFLDDDSRHAKYESAKQAGKKIDIPKTKHVSGGRWGLYHLATIAGARALIVVEGEINGLSVWLVVRAAGWLIDVISVGSEGAFKNLASSISKAAQAYERLIIWADKAQVANEAIPMISHQATIEPIHSIVYEGEELDANELLTMGLLADVLSQLLPSGCCGQVATMPNPHEVAITQAPTFPVTPKAPVFPRITKEMWEQLLSEPADNDLEEQLRQDWLKSKRTYWDLPDDGPTKTSDEQQGGTSQVSTGGHWERGVSSEINLSSLDEPLWAKYASEMTDSEITLSPADSTPDAPYFASERDLEITLNPIGKQTDGNTGSDELLALCAELCDSLDDYERAKRWYLVCEKHYCYGDFTSLLECVEAIQQAILIHTEPCFPDLPPKPATYDEYDTPTAYHQWVWAARAVKLGHTDYLGQALTWARKIEDEGLRARALREMDSLAGSIDIKQMTLL